MRQQGDFSLVHQRRENERGRQRYRHGSVPLQPESHPGFSVTGRAGSCHDAGPGNIEATDAISVQNRRE
jgi:hypothetical protein